MVFSATDRARLDDLYPPFRPLLEQVVTIATAKLDQVEPRRWKIKVVETSRSALKQAEAFASGHSNAPTPDKSAHGIVRKDGSPAAMGADLGIVDAISGTPCPDGDLAWSMIPAACYEVGRSTLRSGAFFTTVRGGDWGHVELRGWERLVEAGILRTG